MTEYISKKRLEAKGRSHYSLLPGGSSPSNPWLCARHSCSERLERLSSFVSMLSILHPFLSIYTLLFADLPLQTFPSSQFPLLA